MLKSQILSKPFDLKVKTINKNLQIKRRQREFGITLYLAYMAAQAEGTFVKRLHVDSELNTALSSYQTIIDFNK